MDPHLGEKKWFKGLYLEGIRQLDFSMFLFCFIFFKLLMYGSANLRKKRGAFRVAVLISTLTAKTYGAIQRRLH